MTQQTWAAGISRTIGLNIKKARNQADKMSAQRLADICAELGHPIPRDVISNLENGRRASVPVTDLLVIAEALGVPALSLVFNPEIAGGFIERTPLQTAYVWESYEETAGLRPMRHVGTPAFETWAKMDHLRELASLEDAAVEHVNDAAALREVREEQSALRSSPRGPKSKIDPFADLAERDQEFETQIDAHEQFALRALKGVFRVRQSLEASNVVLWPPPEVLLSRYSGIVEAGTKKK